MTTIAGEGLLNNLTASAPPTVGDDATRGYAVGSLWFDGRALYILREAGGGSPSAAEWVMVNAEPAGFASGDYVWPRGVATVTDSTPSTSAHVVAWPFVFGRRTAIDRAGVYLATAQAGAACRVAAYDDDFGRPGSLLYDWNEIDLSSGSAVDALQTVDASLLGPAWVLVFVKNVATQATLRCRSAVATPHGHLSLAGYTTQRPLGLATAYPASAPASAPSVAPISFSANLVVPQLRVA